VKPILREARSGKNGGGADHGKPAPRKADVCPAKVLLLEVSRPGLEPGT
jgi:hypothetical protein